MTAEFAIYLVAQCLGTAATLFLAYRSFQKRRIQLGDAPTLPQYFSRRSAYWTGIALYCALMAAIYWLLTWQWLPLEPLFTLIVSNLQSREWLELLEGLDGGTLIPLIFAGSFLFLIDWENRFNPLLILRDSMHDAFAIPTKAAQVYNALMASRLSAVDDHIKAQIADRLLVQSIDSGDFDKSGATVEYKWAHNSLLFDRIQHYADQSSYRRFFNEPSLKWGEICISYNAMSEKVAIWKDAEPHYTKTVLLIKDLDKLTGLLCRLLASLIVFGSPGEDDMWATVRQLGGKVNESQLQNTYKYVLIFTAVTGIGVILGREISVSLHNSILFPEKPLPHFSYTTLRWIAYAIPMYVLPLVLVLVIRALTFGQQQAQAERNYGFYMVMMILGGVLSTTTAAVVLELTFYHRPRFEFLGSFLQHMRWGILPALLSAYVAYRLDTPSGNAESPVKLILAGIARFLGWGTVAVIFMLYATDDLPADVSNLRFTLVGTAFFVVGLLAAFACFKTSRS
ncbi:hypothetical protein NP590_07765 [Methylomonas sp. SURF-2]|uniref:Uncharacterized protein n=1 Tax=Methylomonas subterranea TaxID=2952225 RepID=A0ABT1TFZ4_9GAMM|nr:hypothetical protein [Methylomonas sp. SURF-2]MCQ8103997.1 hypothetical protein [Methylomonas sp. SURF-2]